MEKALQRSEEELHRITDRLTLAVAYADSNQHYRFVNKAYEEWVERSRDEITGRHIREILGEEVYEMIRGRVEAVLSGELVTFEEAVPYREKGLRDVSVIYSPYFGARGEVEGFVAFITDVTERKRAEEALRESEERFRRLAGAAFEGIAISEKGRILEANEQLADMFGYKLAEVIGMQVLEFVAPQSRDLVWQNIESQYEGVYEAWALRKDGSNFPVEACGKPMPYGGRRVRVTALRDIAERKRMEEQLHRAREELEGRVERQLLRRNPYGLTFRELIVLHLVAAGRSNKEIGVELGISPRTAQTHLGNILGKMGAASRTEAGVRALKEGLME